MTDRGGRITVTVQRLLGQPPKPLPIALAGIAADAIYNLRAALDQAGYAVAVAAKTSGKNAHFPFGDTLEEVKSREQGGSKEIPKSIFDAMVALRPFETGNTFLWALNKLCNINKHEFLATMVNASPSGKIDHVAFGKVKRFKFPPEWDSEKNEMEVACVPHGEKPSLNFTIQTVVAIGRIKLADGRPLALGDRPAVAVLNAILGEVERSLTVIESEARRIGLFL